MGVSLQPVVAKPKISLGRLKDLEGKSPKALLIGTYTQEKRLAQEDLEELESLCDTYGLDALEKILCPLRSIDVRTYIGKGKAEEIYQKVLENKIDIVIFDDEILPQQQRNLEKAFECAVIDRTELILGVFAQRAQTKEAKIQIDLAFLRYQMPRLRKMWSHLHRQRSGGASGGAAVKGEGEKQIELDRRIIRRQIEKLQKELEKVKKRRGMQKSLRKKAQIPSFAIIGYTNVGKSTLLNALTDAKVLTEDKLFATLDPTTRKFILPNKQPILLIDTVGFIRKIPHQLIAAFKSTLEEAIQADILIHLVDASHPQTFLQSEATLELLKELKAAHKPIINVLNKADKVNPAVTFSKMRVTFPKLIEISALNKEGFPDLMRRMEEELKSFRKKLSLCIPQSEYASLSKILDQGKILSLKYEENNILLKVEIPKPLENKVRKYIVE